MEFSDSVLNKIKAIISTQSEKAVTGDLKSEGAVEVLKKLEEWIVGQQTNLKKLKEKKQQEVKEFMVHGKIKYYDIGMKAPVFDNLTRIVGAKDEKEAAEKIKQAVEEEEKAKVGTEKVFTKVEIGKITPLV